MQKVEAFNNRCLRRIMNITRAEQRAGYISSVQMRRNFGTDDALEDVVIARRLRWFESCCWNAGGSYSLEALVWLVNP